MYGGNSNDLRETFKEYFQPMALGWDTLHEVSVLTGKNEAELVERMRPYLDLGIIPVVAVFRKEKLS